MATKSAITLPTLGFLLIFLSGTAKAQQPSVLGISSEVTSDFKYLGNNILMDAEDVVTSPLYVASPDSALRSPRFYVALAQFGAVHSRSTRQCAAISAA